MDSIVIWGHGLDHEDEILQKIRQEPGFQIIRLIRYRPKNIKSFVDEVYSFDYAPKVHLRAKLRYLFDCPREVLCVFVKNELPDIDYFGKGFFRHVECKRLKSLKERIRDQFNPFLGGNRTHNHVIHASDNETQAIALLEYLEKSDSLVICIKDFSSQYPSTPCHVDSSKKKVEIFSVKATELYLRVLAGERWKAKSQNMKLEQSPHYSFLTGTSSIYDEYCKTFRGTYLKDDHCKQRFQKLIDNFDLNSSNPILIDETPNKLGKYRIIDGAHRAVILITKGVENILVCKLIS